MGTGLINLGAALVIAASMLAAGVRVRRVARLPLPPGMRWATSLVLGAATVGGGVLALGLAGAVSRGTLLALLAATAAAGDWRRAVRLRPPWAAAAGAAVCLPIAVMPPFFYDALVYHLGLPWQALLEGGFTAHPEDVFAAFPPLAQCIYAPALALGLDRVPALLHWLSFIAAGGALAALARDLGASRRLAALAAVTLPLLPSHLVIAGFPAAEGWMLAAIGVAYGLLLRRRGDGSWPLFAGVLAGIACAARLQALPWAAGAVVLAAARGRARDGLVAAAGCVVGAAPWWVKNLVLLGQPLAPIGWRREGMATLWRDGGSTVFHFSEGADLLRHAIAAISPLVPWLVVLALAASLALIQRRAAPHLWVALAVVAGTIAWVLLAALPRFFAVPALLLLALAAAVRPGPGTRASTAALLFTASVGAWSSVLLLREVTRSVSGHGPVVNDPRPAFAAAAALPADARVLFVGEPRGLGFPRRFMAPSQHDVSPARELIEAATTTAEASAALRARSFTHLLLNRGELGRLASAYPVAPWRTETGRARFAALLRALGPPAVVVGGVEIYALAPTVTDLAEQ